MESIKKPARKRLKKAQIISHLLPEKRKKLLLDSGKIPSDYICPTCGFIFPYMIDRDGSIVAITGAYPFCSNKDQQTHVTGKLERMLKYGEYRVKIRNVGVKTVIFRGPDGKLNVPARTDEKTPDGYERIELSSLAEVDKFNKQLQADARLSYEQYHRIEEAEWNHWYAQQGREMRAGGTYINHEGVEVKIPSWEEMTEMGKDMVRQAEKEFSQYQGYDPNYIPPTFITAAMYDEGSMRYRGRE